MLYTTNLFIAPVYASLLVILTIIPTAMTSTPPEITFLQQFIIPGDLVFDVGANIGKKTDLYLACDARVVCIDPQPSCAQVLRERFAHNQSVIVEPVGLAQTPGILTLFICPQANTISTFSREWQQPNCRFFNQGYTWDDVPLEVPVTTLDQLIIRYGLPAFCKIDVENFEYEVLLGLSQPISYLSFEFAAEVLHNTKKCVDHLAALGYTKFNFAIAEEPKLALSKWVSAQEIIPVIERVAKSKDWKHMWALWGDIYAHYDR